MTDRLRRQHSVGQMPTTWNSQHWNYETAKHFTDPNNNHDNDNSIIYNGDRSYCSGGGRNTICTSSLRKYRNSADPQICRDRANYRDSSNSNNIRIDREILVPRDQHKCNYVNCGKILWVSKSDLRHGSHGNVSSSIASQYYPVKMSADDGGGDYVIRTSLNGLPSTPGPDQRNAYLANQKSVSATIPLIYGPMPYS